MKRSVGKNGSGGGTARRASPPAPLPRYEEWLGFIFGRIDEASDPWRLMWAFDVSPPELVDLVIATFERSGGDLQPYTDRQVAIGLQAIMFNNFSSVVDVLIGPGITEPQRLALIRSIATLYRECLAERSPPVLGHLSETRSSPLEFPTYMMWDVTPIDVMARETPERLEALVAVLADALSLANDACVESALHGLGHLSGSRVVMARTAIDDWLAGRPDVRPELIAYAERARTGCIQ
ncbi:MAG: hypothetical protein KDJ37_15130 [Hyphomicrobiaceae bacterium]|nr:hypothetical protein [Hyphomicrobiaceae bacterium]